MCCIPFASSLTAKMSETFEVHNPLFESILWLVHILKDIDADKVYDLIIHGPQYYSAWWANLLREAPLHLIIETSLCLFIIWLVFIRKTVDPTKSSKQDKLSEKEIEWLLETWRPDPLVPEITEKEQQIVDDMFVSRLHIVLLYCIYLLAVCFMVIALPGHRECRGQPS